MDYPHDGRSYFPPTQLTQRSVTKPNQLTHRSAADTIRYIFAKVLTQMMAKKGIKLYGQAAVAALMKEFAQLEELGVYEAVNETLLTREQRRAALQAINLIKLKRD